MKLQPHAYWTFALKTSKSEKEETDYQCDFSYFPFGTKSLSHSMSDFNILFNMWLKMTLNSLSFVEIESGSSV